ncbi:Permease subunit MlaE of the ABC-type intermembrane phospholipid transporter Mla (MlaE) (PDB:6IC4) [Commensalibacter communis]|uniref:Permease subunit MlaE of the ABC-type intermembrane phospholipid transporter Mla (MlaE) n=1 Tax=Commensalibacter communis TaxID=2972786 RepID=A0A9W4XHV1_9PROT|nr:ABC transporter permease [Commensalibacter communis]CAI3939283.1 Permease subunit MlaE of the ABC-type intermembrane phospholipid transporter Mla (MlaE) (PDB:6IC4) [Commensalibacter communis]CAI3941058.1 Permease subunit MlaE of the ABC-type intermembrane phospholipid transporter Mla (MlaE) (PDB:6IC4) [Commensalibacter communis]CAI3942426.1 Permease subunit MlaE of the ABC-type intermembrane phospholipid transporter Mla (MlaE) (PDB:6IC4) [Commensalibacter communis]CAI3947335.1 Permease subun
MKVNKKSSLPPQPPEWTLKFENNKPILILNGDWLAKNNNIPQLPVDIFKNCSTDISVHINTDRLGSWDSGFVVFLWDVKNLATINGISIDKDNLPVAAQQLVGLLNDKKPEPTLPPKYQFRPLYDLGEWTINSLNSLGVTFQLFIFALKGVFKFLMGRSYMRLNDLLRDIRAAGPSALIIISVVNFLMGSILAFVGAVQLRKFSADAYVANLVGIATVRELAAVMTAIVISGRTGGAYAARIATMQGNEEIDALKVFGIPVTEYLILPSMLSLVITMPIMYLYACLMSIFGGLIVSILMLKVSVIGFLYQTFGAVPFNQFIFGGTKTVAFAMFIGVSSCYIGMKSGRSAADVGVAATKAVVAGIVGVIALDAVFAVLADIIGI